METGDQVTVVSGEHKGKKGLVAMMPRKWVLVKLDDGNTVSIKPTDLKAEGTHNA